MVSPLMNFARMGDRRNTQSPVGMTVVSPSESVSPLDSKMTPTRKMLFQRRRLSSCTRNGTSPLDPIQIVEDETRDETQESSRNVRSASFQKRDGRMRYIQDRFNHIQQGLGTIDEERNHLLEKNQKLEKEKKLIQKQLELREREILSLVKRCASQEEKMRESSKLRSENRELQHQLDSAKRRIGEIGEENEDLNSLKRRLQQSELDREQLQDRLAKLQREHDSVTDTLQDCFANIRQLTEEKQQLEEERRRERRRSEQEMEKNHLAHIAESNNLKENIQAHQSRIQQMEKILQDNMYTTTTLRREKAILSQDHQGEVEEVVRQYERQLSELQEQIDEKLQGKEDYYEGELSRMNRRVEVVVREKEHLSAQMKSEGFGRNVALEEEMQILKEKIEARDHIIEDLEAEFSDQMQKLMSKQSSLDEVEEERRNLEEKVLSMRNLETEHAALLDFVQILDSNLAELTSENAHLILEKDTFQEEAEGLRKQAEILEHQLEMVRKNRKARESDFRDLLEAEKEELRLELEDALVVATKQVRAFKIELDSRAEWISMLEGELRNTRREVVAKRNEIETIKMEMQLLRSNVSVALKKARSEVDSLESEVFSRDRDIAMIEGRLIAATAALESVATSAQIDIGEDSDGCIKSMRGESKDNASQESLECREVPEIESENDERAPEEPESTKRQAASLAKQLQHARNEVMILQKEIDSLSSERSTMLEEVEASRGVVNGRDEQIVSLQQLILQYKKREKELERRLSGPLVPKMVHESNTLEVPSDDIRSLTRTRSTHELHNESTDSRKLLIDFGKKVEAFQSDLIEAQKSRDGSNKKLQKAQKQVIHLESRIIEQSHSADHSLEKKLSTATLTLSNHRQLVEVLEIEQSAHVQRQNEQIKDKNEKQLQIEVLQATIHELEKVVLESRDASMKKDELISALKKRIAESNEDRSTLLFHVEQKCALMESLHNQLESSSQLVDNLEKTTETCIIGKQSQIDELRALATSNAFTMMMLEQKLFEQSYVVEDDGNAKVVKVEDLEEEIQTLLASQTELATEFELSSNAFEAERITWGSKEKALREDVRGLKTKLSVVQGTLEDREIRIKFLEERLNKNDEMYKGLEGTLGQAHRIIEGLKEHKRDLNEKCLALETELVEIRETLNAKYSDLEKRHLHTLGLLKEHEDEIASLRREKDENKEIEYSDLIERLSDNEKEIGRLQQEIEVRGKKIQSMETKIENLSSRDIEQAFVESEKRRSHLKSDLAKTQMENAELKETLDVREKRLLEVSEELARAMNEIAKQSEEIQAKENQCQSLGEKVKDLGEEMVNIHYEVQGLRKSSFADKETALELETLNKKLEKDLGEAKIEIAHQKDLLENLEKAAEKTTTAEYKMSKDKRHHEEKIEALESEMELRQSYESQTADSSQSLADCKRIDTHIARQPEEKCRALTITEEDISNVCDTKSSQTLPPSDLQDKLQKLMTELALRDDEIRELRLVELNDAEDMIASLTKEVNVLTEEVVQKNVERMAEKAILTAEIERLNTQFESVSLHNETQQRRYAESTEDTTALMTALNLVKERLERQVGELNEAVKIRDATIKSLKNSLSLVEQHKMEITDEQNSLRFAEEEAMEEVEILKGELDLAITREKEIAAIKLRNQGTLHREEMDHTLAELESALFKLKESEKLLDERSSLLGEMVEHNKELECRLEKEESNLKSMERKFATERIDLEKAKKDLKLVQEELRRKEAVLQSKLKEERENKEFAEESLKKLKAKYDGAIRTKKCVTELERQNAELRDKIRRQETFLQRKLDKDKMERARLTPLNNFGGSSPAKSVISTRTPTKSGKSTVAGRALPPAHNATAVPPRGSKLPGSSGRSVAMKNSASLSSRRYQSGTPAKRSRIPSSTDRSVTSELSSLFRNPSQSEEQRDESPAVQRWEMDLE